MGKLSAKTYYYILATWLAVFCLHNAQYLIAYSLDRSENTTFTPFTYKAPFGLAEDNLAYAEMIRYASHNPSIFIPDGIIKENEGTKFPMGNIVIVYLGMVHKLLGEINYTYFLGGLLPLLLSVIFIFKTILLFFREHAIPIAIGVCFLILCSNFNDFMGLEKFIKAYFFPNSYQHHGNVLALGYAQRFVYSQSSIFLLLFWIYQLFKYVKDPSLKNQILLILAIGLLQYSYFYYWSFAIPFTIALIAISKNKWKDYVWLAIGIAISSVPYWLEVYAFHQTDFYQEYQEKMGGAQTYDALYGIIIVGSLSILPFLKQGKKWLNISLLIAPVALHLTIEFLNYNFQSFHWIYYTTKLTVLPIFIALGLAARYISNWSTTAMFCLINYYLILLLCSLKFILGFNIQPYHWVYTAFYPILIFAMIKSWLPILKEKTLKKIITIAASITIFLGLFNSYKTAEHNHSFWSIQQDDQEVIEFLKKHPHSVIAGNNMMPLITFVAHTDLYLYEGMTCNSSNMFKESAKRFIQPYKLMGYDDSDILEEFNKYKELPKYHQIFTKGTMEERDSLAQVYPDNLLGSIESMFHYFTSPEKYEDQFITSLHEFTPPSFELNFIVIYKPTFRGDFAFIKDQQVFENSTYIIFRHNNAGILRN